MATRDSGSSSLGTLLAGALIGAAGLLVALDSESTRKHPRA